jgi:hypothetical protein
LTHQEKARLKFPKVNPRKLGLAFLVTACAGVLIAGGALAINFVRHYTPTTALPFATQFGEMPIQYVGPVSGEMITIQIDGRTEQSWAGKLQFQDENGRQWSSYCADLRSPIMEGQGYGVNIIAATKGGGNVPLAGKIVSLGFNKARTAAQCAGLQIAVWEALEYGRHAIGNRSNLKVDANPETMNYAHQFYLAALQAPVGGGGSGAGVGAGAAGGQQQQSGGDNGSTYLQAPSDGGQSQLSP